MCPISKSTAHVVQTGHKHAHAHASSAVHARCSSTTPVLSQSPLGLWLPGSAPQAQSSHAICFEGAWVTQEQTDPTENREIQRELHI